MTIKIRCACGNVLCAPEERLGNTGRCPNCNRQIKVERPTEERPNTNKDNSFIFKESKPLTVSSSEGQKNNLQTKPNWFIRLLSFGIYTLFTFLFIGIILLHALPNERISSFSWLGIKQLKEIWQNYEGFAFMTKDVHRNWIYSLIKKSSTKDSIQNIPNKTPPKMPIMKPPAGQDKIPSLPKKPVKKDDRPI